MLKTYTSPTAVSFNVRLAGGHAHVAFIPHTLGGSSFSTSDVRLQEAIEKHHYFGRLIQLEATPSQQPVTAGVKGGSSEADSGKPKEMRFYSLADAKDYVAEQWDVSRTKLRTRAQIEEAALEHGVVVVIQN